MDGQPYNPVPTASPRANGNKKQRRLSDDGKRSGCCSGDCLETMLIFCNILIWLLGAGLVAIGIYLLLNRSGYLAGLAGHIFFLSHYILIGAGVILVVVASLGCVSTLRKSRGCLQVHATLLFVLLLLQVTAGVLALVFGIHLQERVRSQLSITMLNANFNAVGLPLDDQAEFVDNLQINLRCCGAGSYADWENSLFSKNRNASLKENGRLSVTPSPDSSESEYTTVKMMMKTPASCCRSREQMCSSSTHPSNIYRKGCMSAVAERLRQDMTILIPAAFGVGIVQLLGILLACALIQTTKKSAR